jgi:hypothetical protein
VIPPTNASGSPGTTQCTFRYAFWKLMGRVTPGCLSCCSAGKSIEK